MVALDAAHRVVGAHLPLDRERKHFRQDRQRAVGLVWRALRDFAVQPFDVLIFDRGDLLGTERGLDLRLDDGGVIPLRGRALLLDMLLDELGAQVRDGGRFAVGSNLPDGIAAAVDLPRKPLRFLARGRHVPGRKLADRVAALHAIGLPAVVEDEAHRACGRDPHAETRDHAVVSDPVGALAVLLGRPLQRAHLFVVELLSHDDSPCPHSVRNLAGVLRRSMSSEVSGRQEERPIFTGLTPLSDRNRVRIKGLGKRAETNF